MPTRSIAFWPATPSPGAAPSNPDLDLPIDPQLEGGIKPTDDPVVLRGD